MQNKETVWDALSAEVLYCVIIMYFIHSVSKKKKKIEKLIIFEQWLYRSWIKYMRESMKSACSVYDKALNVWMSVNLIVSMYFNLCFVILIVNPNDWGQS